MYENNRDISPIDLQEETVENILSAARLLQLNAVVNACCDFLQQQLDPSNCLGIAMFAEQQACIPLQMQASEFTRQNFMEVFGSDVILSNFFCTSTNVKAIFRFTKIRNF